MGLRESINEKPWLGWVMAGIILVGAIVMYMRLTGGSSEVTSADRATEMVTIKFTDDGSEMQIPWGRVQLRLMEEQNGRVDPSKGLRNPKTGAFTGFPYDKASWEKLCETINKVNDDLQKQRESGQQPK